MFAQTNTGPENRMEKGRQFLGLAPPADSVAAARGQKLFVQICGFCHGANATGAEGPDLVRSDIVLHDEHGDLIGQVILKGRPDRGMPSFPNMTADPVLDIAEFLHARVEAAANRYGYRILNVVTGDAKSGEAFFTANCTGCHSATGDLSHIAAKFQPADLQAQFLYPVSPAVEPQATITLAGGEKISGKLKRIDDFNISIWTSSGEYASWPRDAGKVQILDPLQRHRDLLPKYANTDMHNVLAYLETLK
jgi:mono/diheme cytochrome c family protein